MGLIIESLFFTNVWIFLYNNLLFYQRLTIPPPKIAEFIIGIWPKPEPSEIPLYIILTFITVLVIFSLRFVLKKIDKLTDLEFKSSRLFILSQLLLFFFLLAIFINYLGGYPLKGDIYPYSKEIPFVNFFYLFVYLGIIGIIIFESYIIAQFGKNKKLFRFLLVVLIILTIGIFTFEPKFPLSTLDYSFFFGPIYEVAHGKTIFTETSSQYGFLSTLFLTLLYKIKILSLSYLPAFIWLLYIAQYFLCFWIIKKVSRSITLSLICLFSIITINYYSVFQLPITFPQGGAMRWIPLIVSATIFYLRDGFESGLFLLSTAILSFWMVDSGIALILAYFATIFIFFLVKIYDARTSFKLGLKFILTLIGIYLLINIIQVILGYRFINFFQIFLRLRQYAQEGITMIPIESITFFWIVIFIYFLSIVYFFRKKEVNLSDQLLIFISNLSLFASIYYIGRSVQHNLFHISIFPLLNIFTLIGIYYKKNFSKRFKITSVILLFLIFIIIPAFNRKEILSQLIKQKLKNTTGGRIFTSDFDSMLNKRFKDEIKLIHDNLADEEIAILSIDDTFLFYLTEKRNLFFNNPQIEVITHEESNYNLRKTVQVCPKKIAVDCRVFKKCEDYKPLNPSVFVFQTSFLNIIQEKCHVRYEPTMCTKQLCVAISQKNK